MTDDISFLRLENHGPYDTWPKKKQASVKLKVIRADQKGKNPFSSYEWNDLLFVKTFISITQDAIAMW